jgi:hypothetical protein
MSIEGSSMSKKGRGRAAATIAMIAAMIEIAKAIQPCSVRALAYQLFNRKLIPSMELKHTKRVSEVCTIAREEGSLPWHWIVDPTRVMRKLPTWRDPEDYADSVMDGYRMYKWADQPLLIVVMSEKATVEGTIRPVLHDYEVPYQILHGWAGATPVWDAAQANLRSNQKVLIIYIGDFDPSGMFMSQVDLPKRLARYSSANPAEKDVSSAWVHAKLKEVGIEIRRIALTAGDTMALGPAVRFPAVSKENDSRYEWFVSNHGNWCWELDAMSPVDLRTRLALAIRAELDLGAWNRAAHIEGLQRDQIIETVSGWNNIIWPGRHRPDPDDQ